MSIVVRRKQYLVWGLLLLGGLLLTGPALLNQFSSLTISASLREYYAQLKTADISEEKQKARSYNDQLRENTPVPQEEYAKTLDIADGIMGILSVPKIAVELPIYHGIGEDVLRKGAGHMPNTALPLGGEGNHTVLTGHTGYPGAELFTNLTRLETGDSFQLFVLDEVLTYRVDQIRIVTPDRGEELLPIAGADYCTLVTCTPYGVNSHRLLVRGKRVEE